METKAFSYLWFFTNHLLRIETIGPHAVFFLRNKKWAIISFTFYLRVSRYRNAVLFFRRHQWNMLTCYTLNPNYKQACKFDLLINLFCCFNAASCNFYSRKVQIHWILKWVHLQIKCKCIKLIIVQSWIQGKYHLKVHA